MTKSVNLWFFLFIILLYTKPYNCGTRGVFWDVVACVQCIQCTPGSCGTVRRLTRITFAIENLYYLLSNNKYVSDGVFTYFICWVRCLTVFKTENICSGVVDLARTFKPTLPFDTTWAKLVVEFEITFLITNYWSDFITHLMTYLLHKYIFLISYFNLKLFLIWNSFIILLVYKWDCCIISLIIITIKF